MGIQRNAGVPAVRRASGKGEAGGGVEMQQGGPFGLM